MSRKRTPTLADVAKLAGVSVATASKALNGRNEVRDSTRARVILSAEQLAFRHNAVARGLALGRSGTVGLLTSDLEGRFSLPILMGAEDAFGANEISVLLSDARGDRIREARHLRTLSNKQIDALMVVGSKTDPRRSLGADLPFPTVYVYTPSESEADCSLTPDNVHAGHLAARHMLDVGRTRILHITGPQDERATQDREHGIDAEMDRASMKLSHRTSYGEWSGRWGRSATLMAFENGTEYDAILCDSDQIARGALDALLILGKSVPNDVALMGFDNWESLVSDSSPPITSIDMSLDHLAHRAAGLLSAAIDGGELPAGVEHVPCRLVVRESTTP